MPVFNNILAGAAGQGGAVDDGYKIQRSVLFESDRDTNFTFSPSTNFNRQKFTIAFWFKPWDRDYALCSSGTSSQEYFEVKYNSNNQIEIFGQNINTLTSTQKLRDHSAWYHICIMFDKQNSTSSKRCRLFVNGIFDKEHSQSSTSNVYWGHVGQTHKFGGRSWSSSDKGKFAGAEFYWLNGVNISTSTDADGTVTGIPGSEYLDDLIEFDDYKNLQPKEYSGTFSSYCQHLKFEDNSGTSSLGNDSSGNNLHWTANNFAATWHADTGSLVDTPTHYTRASGNPSSNYCTFNLYSLVGGELKQGNVSYDIGSGTKRCEGTMAVKSGKYYWEAKALSGVTNGSVGGRVGICQQSSKTNPEQLEFNLAWHATGGVGFHRNGAYTGIASNSTNYSDGDVIGVALDADNNIVYFYKNGTLAYTINFSYYLRPGTKFLTPHAWNASSGTPAWKYCWGERPFTHTPRTGHKTLCAANLPTPATLDGTKYFNTMVWTGNSGNSQQIQHVGHSTDMVWIKGRSNQSGPFIQDIVRGTGDKALPVFNNGQEGSEDYGQIQSFDTDGFTVEAGSSSDENANYNGRTYVGWSWECSGTNTTVNAGAANSTAYDSRTLWRNAVSGTPYSGQSAATVFNASDGGMHAASGNSVTFTTPSGYALSGNLVLRMARGAGTSAPYGDYDVKVNGNSVFDNNLFPYNETALIEIGHFDSITSIEWGYGGNSSDDWIQINSIYINGKELIDSDVSSPPNIPTVQTTYRADNNAGFSIVEANYGTGTHILTHGLNERPDWIFHKRLTGGNEQWYVAGSQFPDEDRMMYLDSVSNNGDSYLGERDWNSSVFNYNSNAGRHIAYCWVEKPGFSASGFYYGNSSSSGPFNYCGFKPAMIIVKKWDNCDSNSGWHMYDNKRNTYNPLNNFLLASEPYYENRASNNSTDIHSYTFDFYANGFRPSHSSNNLNNSGSRYIWFAWASHPFNTARAF
jgi:hypothetical protein